VLGLQRRVAAQRKTQGEEARWLEAFVVVGLERGRGIGQFPDQAKVRRGFAVAVVVRVDLIVTQAELRTDPGQQRETGLEEQAGSLAVEAEIQRLRTTGAKEIAAAGKLPILVGKLGTGNDGELGTPVPVQHQA